MSTTTIEDPAALAAPEPVAAPPATATPAATTTPAPADPAIRTYRGRTLEELLPQIREQLGPEAIVVRQREGLMGGIGGFFQQRFVEVDARTGHRRIDVYDEQPDTPESFAKLLADAEDHADPIVTAAAFAPPTGTSQPVFPPAPEESAPIEPAPAAPNADRAGGAGKLSPAAPPAGTLPRRQDPPAATPEPSPDLATALEPKPDLATTLERTGLTPAFAERLLADAEAHELPFTNGDLRRAVRRALARRIPTALPYRAGGLAIAFAGSGSTSCADALATTYVRAGHRAHAVATIDQARTRIDRGAPDALVALDLPPIPSGRDAVDAMAQQLASLELDETLVVVPADAGLAEAQALLDRLAPLAPTGIALTCDNLSTSIGAAIELACTTRMPLAYVLDGAPVGTLAPADPAALAERLLP